MKLGITTILPKVGPIAATPEELRNALVALAVAENPGLTTNLPGTLIEDIVSTDVAALALAEQAKVETIASVSPYAANLYILNMLGQIYGVTQGAGFNTSVYVVFDGTPGLTIPQGTLVTDGTYTYSTQSASIIDSAGESSQVYCVALQSGSWPVPANSVQTVTSSVPAGYSLDVNNPLPGIPATSAQTAEDYRAQVLQAGLSDCDGMISMVKTVVKRVPGVVGSLVSIRQNDFYVPPRWEVIVGGGDTIAVADAIWKCIGDPGVLCGAVMQITNVNTSTREISTILSTIGFTVGDVIYVQEVAGITGINNIALTITDIGPFSITTTGTFSGSYAGGGYVSTSQSAIELPRNAIVTVYDPPDSYDITYVIPVQQATQVEVTWNTSASTVIDNAAVASLATPDLQNYINTLGPGQYINFYEMQYLFQESVVDLIPTPLITHIEFAVTVNGQILTPAPNTGVVVGDPNGYYYATSADITFVRG
jgi:hypothetical protein